MNDEMEKGKQFVPPKKATQRPGKTGQYGGKAPAKGKRYDTATNSFRSLKPKTGKVAQAKGLNGKGHDGKFGAPDGGPGRDGRVGGTGGTPSGNFLGSGIQAPSDMSDTPTGRKIGQKAKF